MTPKAPTGRAAPRGFRFAIVFVLPLFAVCVGGCRSSSDPPAITPVSTPAAPTNLAANVGTQRVSLGWEAPNNGGSAIVEYEVTSTPAIAAGNIVIAGTRALVGGLTVGTGYSFSVRARNSVGFGPSSAAVAVTTQAPSSAAYQALTINGDDSPSGVFDPSVLRVANGDLWMSYSSVNYYNNASSQFVQDVGIRLARSTGGAAFDYVATIASPVDVTLAACGVSPCVGRWVYETSWLIEDAADPNPARRFKLFAHKYFLRPASTPANFYHLGAIVMWTAPAPDGAWSAETSLLGWDQTPAELTALRNVNGLHADLANCIVVTEGSASVRGSATDFVFACPHQVGGNIVQKIVLLRTTDHANTFQYISTLLAPSDAATIGAQYFSAPSLLAAPGTAPVLLATPVFNGLYSGCYVFPLQDDATGQIYRVNNVPAGLLLTPLLTTFGGACAYDRGLGARGILQSNLLPGATPLAHQFRIHATQAVLQRP